MQTAAAPSLLDTLLRPGPCSETMTRLPSRQRATAQLQGPGRIFLQLRNRLREFVTVEPELHIREQLREQLSRLTATGFNDLR